MKRMALILALSILTTCIFVSMPIKKAEASTVITRELINAALSRYTATDGRYWTYDSNVNGADTAWTGSAHYSNSTSSGTWRQYGDTAKDFFGGRQCWGFAEFVGWVVTGGTSKNDVLSEAVVGQNTIQNSLIWLPAALKWAILFTIMVIASWFMKCCLMENSR